MGTLKEKMGDLKLRVKRSKCIVALRQWARTFSLPGFKGVPIINILNHLKVSIGQGKLWRAARGLAFAFLMALPPLLIVIFTCVAFLPFDGIQDELLGQLQAILPEKIYEPLSATVNDVLGHKHKSMLSIGFLLSIFFAANAVHGMMMYFADISAFTPEVKELKFLPNLMPERRKFIKRYPLCIAIVLMLYLQLVLVAILLIGYRSCLAWIFNHGIIIDGSLTYWLVAVGRWVILVGMGLLTICAIYYIIPLKKQRVHFFSPGSIFSMGMFILLSFGFREYFVYFNQYNLLYGSIGSLMVVMMWLFFNCLVLLLGYDLNTAIVEGQGLFSPVAKNNTNEEI
ncbi:MAG: YihY/virulence factor BrkB family protein [Bacteroidales bacterium]|nr:YihY/virulence factor BrkB family protein [Bacteroidales bacterium]